MTDVPPPGAPAADVAVTVAVVRGLLATQHPDLAELPLLFGLSGWDNVTVRLGDNLAVRLPRRRLAVDCLRNEQRWLPDLARVLPLPVPAAVRVGEPDESFPYPWSVVPWFDGRPAGVRPPRREGIEELGRFLRALHHSPPPDSPRNAFRGGPLVERDDAMRERLRRVAVVGIETASAERLWRRGLDAAPSREDVWLHGDMHAGNVLVGVDGRISGVIDWGDICRGDPASDLAAAWLVVHDAGALFAAYGPLEDGLADRAAAWAAYLAVMLLQADPPGEDRHASAGRRTLERLAALP